jgi:prepilin signal peptidase PulO-like enzyme (type II secretory pathway)
MILQVLLGAAIFAAAGAGGAVAAAALVPRLARFEDGPAPVRVSAIGLIAGSALLGAFLAWRHAPPHIFAVAAFVTLVLVAVWYCDARTGIVPDLFTLAPLAALLSYEFFVHEGALAVFWAAVVFAPFAIAALLSRGHGMGWGDAKLAAFGGAFLGISAFPAFGIASLVAVIVAAIRGKQDTPIAFAPYLCAAIAIAIALQYR